MRIRIRLTDSSRKSLVERLQQAYSRGHIRLVKRIHALLYVVDGESVAKVSALLHLGEQTVRGYVQAFLGKGLDSLVYKKPSGCPPKLTKTQRKELTALITAGPEAAGYVSGCWTANMLQDLILCHFGVVYHPHYVCTLLRQLGFSFQKARFVSDHLDEEARRQWREQTWPELLRLAQNKQALILFGDEASFAQWGSLAHTWAPIGQQPTVKTSGRRKGYKVFGLIDYCSGHFFSKAQTDRFDGQSYAAFLSEVLTRTTEHIILIQDGAKYHTSRFMNEFFAAHADRLTKYQLPSYSPDFNPIEFLWKKIKKRATHLHFFADFATLIKKVNEALLYFACMPSEITSLMGLYCESLGEAS
jgi:transposase